MSEKDITKTELLGAINKGFTAVEKRLSGVEKKMATKDDLKSVEQRLGQKIDSVRASLDSEIMRRIDERAVILKRLDTLEALHGISHDEKKPLAV